MIMLSMTQTKIRMVFSHRNGMLHKINKEQYQRLQQKETDIAKLSTGREMHLHPVQILKHGHMQKAIEASTQSIRYMLEITTQIISM